MGRKPTLQELIEFGEAAIERINQRTINNESVYGGRFTPYSEKYAELKGVSRNSVDLFLDGDMLDSLEFDVDDIRGSVEIKLGGDELQTKKGFNHHVGDTLPRRPWFGVTSDETSQLLAAIADEAEEVQDEPEQRLTLRDLIEAAGSITLEAD